MNARESAARAYAFEDEETDFVAEMRDESVFSVGAYLSQQRRLRGLSLDALEAATRIPRRSLARLEAGAFDHQQDAFVRGFVRTVAGAIGVDPIDTLERMADAAPGRATRRRRLPWRAAGAGLAAAVLLAASVALAVGLAGREVPAPVAAASAPPEPVVSMRRDPVRLLAERVRQASPGAYARPRPLAPPPHMFLAPAGTVALDAVFRGPDPERPDLPAVSAGIE